MLLVMGRLIYEACFEVPVAVRVVARVWEAPACPLTWWLGCALPVQKQKWLGESTKGQRERVFPPPKWLGIVWSLHSVFCQTASVLTLDFGNKCLGKGMNESEIAFCLLLSFIHKSPSQLRGDASTSLPLAEWCDIHGVARNFCSRELVGHFQDGLHWHS